MINLDKGSKISLDKDLGGIRKLRLGVGWLPQGYVLERLRETKLNQETAATQSNRKKGFMDKLGDFFKGDARAGDVLNAATDSVRDTFNYLAGDEFGSSMSAGQIEDTLKKFKDVDVDTSISFLSKGRIIQTVSFAQNRAFNGAVIHHGDNTTGQPGKGQSMEDDKEQIDIDFDLLDKFAPEIDEAIMYLNVFNGHSKGQHFGNFGGSFARLSDQNSNELAFFNLTEKYDHKEGVFLLRVYKYNNDWRIETLAIPVAYAPHFRDMEEYYRKNGLVAI